MFGNSEVQELQGVQTQDKEDGFLDVARTIERSLKEYYIKLCPLKLYSAIQYFPTV
jgi:hypothetical protein